MCFCHWRIKVLIWNASKRLVSAADSVRVSQAYVRTGRTSVWYTRTLVGKDRYRSLQIGCRDDMTDDARTMRRFMSGWLPSSEDRMLPRYTKLSTCSTVLPSTVMLGGCGPEPKFWILVFAQETRRHAVVLQCYKVNGWMRIIRYGLNRYQFVDSYFTTAWTTNSKDNV